jgi:hypothetical protein
LCPARLRYLRRRDMYSAAREQVPTAPPDLAIPAPQATQALRPQSLAKLLVLGPRPLAALSSAAPVHPVKLLTRLGPERRPMAPHVLLRVARVIRAQRLLSLAVQADPGPLLLVVLILMVVRRIPVFRKVTPPLLAETLLRLAPAIPAPVLLAGMIIMEFVINIKAVALLIVVWVKPHLVSIRSVRPPAPLRLKCIAI